MEIYFTQCDPHFEICERTRIAMTKPVNVRLEYYQNQILFGNGDQVWFTVDELLILCVQYWVRNKILKEVVKFHSVCMHDHRTITLTLDEQGDFTEEMHHGFFSQRLELLR